MKIQSQKHSWVCLNCGECCAEGNISLSKEEYDLIHKKIPLSTKMVFDRVVVPHDEDSKLLMIKGKCPFYSKQKKKCLIYKIRPFMCRYFICGRKSTDEELVFTDGMCQNPIIPYKNDLIFKRIVDQIVDESISWAVTHGWIKRANVIMPRLQK